MFTMGPALRGGEVDPNFGSVVLLMHCEGADSGTVFTDSSSYNRTITRYGTTVTSTTQKLFGSASVKGVSNGDTLTFSGTTDFRLDGTFTLEFSVYLDSLPGSSIFFMAGSGSRYLALSSAGKISLGVGPIFPDTVTLTTGAWHRVAVCQSIASNYLKTFLNGAVTYSTNAYAVDSASTGLSLLSLGGGDTRSLIGYIDEVRFTKGVARYSAAYTPDAAPFANS